MEKSRTQSPIFCQQALKKELEEITKDMLFQQPQSEELARLHVFGQSLPVPSKKHTEEDMYETIEYVDGEEEAAVFQCPWCLVKIDGGHITGVNEPQEIGIVICFGIYNKESDNQGHVEIVNLIQRVYERFATNPILDKKYVCQGEFEWQLQEEDTYPYFFGAIATKFKFQGFMREDLYGFS